MFDKWAEYDPKGTGILSPEKFAFFIHDIPPPIGLKDNNSVKYEGDLSSKERESEQRKFDTYNIFFI